MKLIVIGGGAAGFFGAIASAESYLNATPAQASLANVQITLLEAGRQPLSKVRISGGGRCNVTHACFEPTLLIHHYPRGGQALRGAFTRFQPQDTVAWFRHHGVSLKTESDGRMFPVTDDALTIVECLMRSARQAGVAILTGATVTQVTHSASGFTVALKSGQPLICDRLLLATGSHPLGYQIAQALGHQLEPPVPSLFTFNIAEPCLQELAGVAVASVHATLLLPHATTHEPTLAQTGALLITHWGLSGPAILKLSAWGARLLHHHQYQGTVQINWLPHLQPDTLRQQLAALKTDWGKRSIASHSPFPELSRRLWQYLLAKAEIQPDRRWADLSKKSLNQLVQILTQSRYPIQGKGIFKEEFVTCGGVRLAEVNFKTMESRRCPGLYFAGEILDIDGVTGGFNFQSAWTTGWLAGQAIARSFC